MRFSILVFFICMTCAALVISSGYPSLDRKANVLSAVTKNYGFNLTMIANQGLVPAITLDANKFLVAHPPHPPLLSMAPTDKYGCSATHCLPCTLNITSCQIPQDIHLTPNGYITIPRLYDDQGGKLNITVIDKPKLIEGDRKYPPAVNNCRGFSPGLYQEGANWIAASMNNAIGFSVKWKMPEGGITAPTNLGIYYNPVNFVYPVPRLGDFDFFQVDYAKGSLFEATDYSGWHMTYSYVDPETKQRLYPGQELNDSIPNRPGDNYTIIAMLETTSMAHPYSYVVQVELNGHAWVSYRDLCNTFISDPANPYCYSPVPGNIAMLQSFQDQYLFSPGPINNQLTADEVSHPKLIRYSSPDGLQYDDAAIANSPLTWDLLNNGWKNGQTMDLLSPDITKGTVNYLHDRPRDCPSFVPEFPTVTVALTVAIFGIIGFGYFGPRKF